MEHLYALGASQVALMVKNPPASSGDLRDAGLMPGLMQDREDSLEEDMAPTPVSCLENPMDKEPGGHSPSFWWLSDGELFTAEAP